jgi:hypothetical protein
MCIFKRGTSNAEGRNLLLKHAINNTDAKYFVFFDDDAELVCGQTLLDGVNKGSIGSYRKNFTNFANSEFGKFTPTAHLSCWESFTDMLLDKETTYPFVKPLSGYDNADAFTIMYQSCCDENFKAFHKDYLWFFYPSSLHNEHLSWTFTGRSKMYLAQRCYQFAWKVDGRWQAINRQHRKYPKNSKDDLVIDLLNFTYPGLAPWDASKFKINHRCQSAPFQPVQIDDIDPQCITTLKARYQSWLDGEFDKGANILHR